MDHIPSASCRPLQANLQYSDFNERCSFDLRKQVMQFPSCIKTSSDSETNSMMPYLNAGFHLISYVASSPLGPVGDAGLPAYTVLSSHTPLITLPALRMHARFRRDLSKTIVPAPSHALSSIRTSPVLYAKVSLLLLWLAVRTMLLIEMDTPSPMKRPPLPSIWQYSLIIVFSPMVMFSGDTTTVFMRILLPLPILIPNAL